MKEIIFSKMDTSVVYKGQAFTTRLNIAVKNEKGVKDLQIIDHLDPRFEIIHPEIRKMVRDNKLTITKKEDPNLKFRPPNTFLTIEYDLTPNFTYDLNLDKFPPLENLEQFLLELKSRALDISLDKDPFNLSIRTEVSYINLDTGKKEKQTILTNYEIAYPMVIPVKPLILEDEHHRIIAFQNVGNVDAFNIGVDIDLEKFEGKLVGIVSINCHDRYGNTIPFEIFFGEKERSDAHEDLIEKIGVLNVKEIFYEKPIVH